MELVVQVSKALPKDAVDLTWQDGENVTRVLGSLDVSLHHPSPGEAFGGVCARPDHHIPQPYITKDSPIRLTKFLMLS